MQDVALDEERNELIAVDRINEMKLNPRNFSLRSTRKIALKYRHCLTRSGSREQNLWSVREYQ